MLRKWLTCCNHNSSDYKFEVTNIDELCDVDDQILNYLAHEIVIAHALPKMMRNEYNLLIEDLEDANLEVLKDYTENEVLPDKDTSQGLMARIGNFGEVLSANFLVEHEDYWMPIYKLRYREKKDWAMKLTDLCLIKVKDLPKPIVCYGEAKTHSSRRNNNLGVQGHDSLAKDDALSNPEILKFITAWFYEKDMFDEADFLSKIRLGKQEYDSRHNLFLIHDKASWDNIILDNLNNHDLDVRLRGFSVKVVLISELRKIIDTVYERAWVGAKEVVDG